jgi:hypothetical protein
MQKDCSENTSRSRPSHKSRTLVVSTLRECQQEFLKLLAGRLQSSRWGLRRASSMFCLLLATKYQKKCSIMTNPAPAMKQKNINSPILVDPASRAPEMMIISADCEMVGGLLRSRHGKVALITQMAAFRPHLLAKYVMVNTNIDALVKKTPRHLRLLVITLRYYDEARNGEQSAYTHERYQTSGIRSCSKIEVGNKGRLCLSASAVSQPGYVPSYT